ncbi:MAG TPA: hypothetical protein VMT05_09585 [Terriglobales bacterium]|jgi:hypothetical protein|nr:hypothetical protein [Terriglobales bacterium]
MPVTITSLEPAAQFLEVCETLVVSAHGCALRSPIKLEAGVPLQFRVSNGRQTTAHVVECHPIGANQVGWKVAAKLDLPGNFWGLSSCPGDWMQLTEMGGEPSVPIVGSNPGSLPRMPMLRALVAEQVEPLRAGLAEVRERLEQQKRRNRFDVSLTHIPPEVEEKVWMRLREDLGTQALRLTREQAEKVLGAAQSAIELKITEVQEEFRNWTRDQTQTLEQRMTALSGQTADELRQHLRAAGQEFDQRASAAGAALVQQGEQLLQSLMRRLEAEQQSLHRDLEAAQAAAAAESSRLETQLGELGRRIAELQETTQHLESGLHTRLVRMSTEIVSGARTQLESAADSLFVDLAARNARDLGQQLEEATARLKNLQAETEASVSESVRSSTSETLRSFEKTMDDSAQRAVGRWRLALAQDLDSLAKLLGEHFRSGANGDGGEKR